MSRHRLLLPALRAICGASWHFSDCPPEEAEARCAAGGPAAILFDLALADEPSSRRKLLELGERLAGQHPLVALLGPAPHHPETALPAGLHGGLTVDDPLEDWPLALAAAARGAAHFSAALAGHLVPETNGAHPEIEKPLSLREREILRLLQRGLATRAIAEQLGRSIKTVEAHVQRMKAKLGRRSLEELRG